MKKMLKITGCIIFIIAVLIAALLIYLANNPAVPNNYTETVKTGGELEAKYIAMGEHKVSYFESAAMMSFKKYEIFYPADISEMNRSLPVVVFVNGTGVTGSKYQALQKHLDHIGITGHSQGGIGVINAITDQKHSDIYKAAVMLSSAKTVMSEALQWTSDPTLIKAPTMIIGSTGNTDEQIAPLESLQKLYNDIPNNVTKVMARRNDADHGQMLYYADGYVTAWFMYYLNGDTEAGNAFFGDNAEILSNANFQDIKKNH
ncbi:alpha/beta hydrolase [Paenibacillus sp. P2(2022)]|uniref:alpha/beta hydrolase family protein n=1 Tax=Paenibacillus TaxID=44249 RepID=UPI002404BD8E|nr:MULTISPECIES: alpha/beta hydrolase [Paenibacillus]MDG0053393.1 alpha/beta hydrolase [Paenibacillus sp. P2(2022)]WOZ40737.1 alpha/beta hydrolase [Paenibacillus polymyxa]